MLSGAGEGRRESYCLIGVEFPSCKRTNVLEMDGGDGCPTMRVQLLPLNRTLKNGPNSKFYVYFTVI